MNDQILDGKIIAADFDGTLSHYESWKGVGVFGKPILSAVWAMERFKAMGAIVIIHTCRKEIGAVADYLRKHKIPYDHINYSPRNVTLGLSHKKVAADIYIDDKAVGFRGEWKDTYLQVINFRRWEKTFGNAISSKG